ncbi:hypothetical protein SAMN00790413_02077 [Deinococcus hopiensis KR-140]|uniref:Uncharacterized protein n=1 Tax=Deinococcus hopiensis KR-140 TaxID=695939 RepID=A0A1W1VJZ3_9DEIO|nr:hypothetical protein SAMN00790413_02077 [Deinococcus hopiensis KR-140]
MCQRANFFLTGPGERNAHGGEWGAVRAALPRAAPFGQMRKVLPHKGGGTCLNPREVGLQRLAMRSLKGHEIGARHRRQRVHAHLPQRPQAARPPHPVAQRLGVLIQFAGRRRNGARLRPERGQDAGRSRNQAGRPPSRRPARSGFRNWAASSPAGYAHTGGMTFQTRETGSFSLPTAVLSRRAGMTGWMWRGVTASLPGVHVLAPNLPGLGQNAHPGPFSAEKAADHLAALIARWAHCTVGTRRPGTRRWAFPPGGRGAVATQVTATHLRSSAARSSLEPPSHPLRGGISPDRPGPCAPPVGSPTVGDAGARALGLSAKEQTQLCPLTPGP